MNQLVIVVFALNKNPILIKLQKNVKSLHVLKILNGIPIY